MNVGHVPGQHNGRPGVVRGHKHPVTIHGLHHGFLPRWQREQRQRLITSGIVPAGKSNGDFGVLVIGAEILDFLFHIIEKGRVHSLR